jgi:hypothetical protein
METLIGLLHRLKKKLEKFTAGHSPSSGSPEHDKAGSGEVVDIVEFLRKAWAERKPLEPITPEEFFSRIMESKGSDRKEAAHEHIQELRAEWN